jgi:hypothetical protein
MAAASLVRARGRSRVSSLLELPDDLFDALLATLPPREDRNLEASLFSALKNSGLECRADGSRSRRMHTPSASLSSRSAPGSPSWNDNPKPFVWHKTAEEILDSLAAYCDLD